MAARAHSADPRAERVRALLRDAAFALAHERAVDGLTVGDVVARAGVSRQVFYQHFTDRDDAVATAVTVAFAAATADIGGDARARILRLFDFVAEHRAVYRHVVSSTVAQRVVAAFRAELTPACEEMASAAMPAVTAIAGVAPEAVIRFLVGGFTEVLRSWMDDPSATDLGDRVRAALDTVNALLGVPEHSRGSRHG
ncbi:TetR/AcrR family transcriptional regulator [Mycobacterium sp. 1164985.4]|uniref:TetR/AcrR family transcriptional regulator n=1 Tax=Mycobacterium sp. 1164985.4 TaxID=1834069 RepID=UPI0008010FD1|nr:TetR/AcrR family transcriptional regulator [Mycobacterium sp. 1164985.4]OBK73912.1 TetR family transcriptional regulator [Mycobacterium sp. 1164985.4]